LICRLKYGDDLDSMTTVLLHLFRLLPFLVGGHRQLALENLASCHQLTVYKRTVPVAAPHAHPARHRRVQPPRMRLEIPTPGRRTLSSHAGPPTPVSTPSITRRINASAVQTAPAPGDGWTLDTTGMQPFGYMIRVVARDRAIVNSQAVEHWASDAAGFCLEVAEEVSRLQFGGTRVAAPGPRGRNPCWD
jgi:hypothetical protein